MVRSTVRAFAASLVRAKPMVTWLSAAIVIAVLMSAAAGARQIRLANGRVIQGEIVGDISEQGFNFKLSDTGGQAYFRWSQINEDDAKRIRKIEDPDAKIQLVVYMTGDRLNMQYGDPIEGIVEVFSDHYEVTNLKLNKKAIPFSDVLETDGLQKGVQIDARVMKTPPDVLKYQTDLIRPATAEDFYGLARLAEKMGLYDDAKKLLASCLGLTPAPRLQGVAESMAARVEELLQAKLYLDLIVDARKDADKDAYNNALQKLDPIIKGQNTGPKVPEQILLKLKEVRDEIDLEFTMYVIRNYFVEMPKCSYAFFNKKENRETSDQDGITYQEAMNYGRRGLQDDIFRAIAARVDPVQAPAKTKDADPAVLKDIERRFRDRLINTKVGKLRIFTATFTKDGWYQIVGGNLPVAGKKKVTQNQSSGLPVPGGNNSSNRGNRPPNGNGNGNGNGNFPGSTIDPDGFAGVDADSDTQLQDKPKGDGKAPEGGGDASDAIRKAIEDAFKKAVGGDAGAAGSGNGGATPRKEKQYKDDDPRIKLGDDDEVKPMTEWWKALSPSARSKWIIAFHARHGGILEYERSYEQVKYW